MKFISVPMWFAGDLERRRTGDHVPAHAYRGDRVGGGVYCFKQQSPEVVIDRRLPWAMHTFPFFFRPVLLLLFSYLFTQ